MTKIKKNDKVIVLSGKDKGKTGKVLRFNAATNRAVVEGINIHKKHLRKRSEDTPSGIVEVPGTIHISNIALFCPNCKKGTRVSLSISADKSKVRNCKKCNNIL